MIKVVGLNTLKYLENHRICSIIFPDPPSYILGQKPEFDVRDLTTEFVECNWILYDWFKYVEMIGKHFHIPMKREVYLICFVPASLLSII